MGLGDWIFIAVFLGIAVLGAIMGLGRGLKILTGGIFGIIISVLICYCLGGIILEIPFISQLLKDLAAHWAHIDWLTKIHLEIIIYYIALFIITMLVRILLVWIIRHVVESDFIVLKILNKVGGALLLVAVGFMLMFLVFQIIGWIGGQTEISFYEKLVTNGNAILRPLYEHNPMNSLIQHVKNALK